MLTRTIASSSREADQPQSRPVEGGDAWKVAEALRTQDGPVFVDLDETLYLRNSTEDFLDSAWPGPLAFLLTKVLDVLRPWRFTGGPGTRDVWRVAAVLILLPWSLWQWRRLAARRGAESANRPLIAALRERGLPFTIVTLGFAPIVRPLIAAMGLAEVPVIAMRWWSFQDRREGKLASIRRQVEPAAIRRSLVITDSEDDRDLLDACQTPLLMVWPTARFHPAFQQVYVPGLYITRIKRPGVRFIYRSIISDEFSVWVLASLLLATQPLLHIVGLAFLSLSFWAIYESGYVDNDRVGARFEKDPVLTAAFFERRNEFPTLLPWLWAAGCGVIALFLLRWPTTPVASDLVAWGGVLVFTALWFRLYNRLDKDTRVWFFAGLQMLRSMSFVAVVSVSLIGAAALLSHALARWVPYYTYRATRTKYNDDQVNSTRLLFFVLLAFSLGIAQGWDAILTPVGFILLGWFAFKARRELVRNIRRVHLITHDSSRSRATGPNRP
jgi:hypothetical protein